MECRGFGWRRLGGPGMVDKVVDGERKASDATDNDEL